MRAVACAKLARRAGSVDRDAFLPGKSFDTAPLPAKREAGEWETAHGGPVAAPGPLAARAGVVAGRGTTEGVTLRMTSETDKKKTDGDTGRPATGAAAKPGDPAKAPPTGAAGKAPAPGAGATAAGTGGAAGPGGAPSASAPAERRPSGGAASTAATPPGGGSGGGAPPGGGSGAAAPAPEHRGSSGRLGLFIAFVIGVVIGGYLVLADRGLVDRPDWLLADASPAPDPLAQKVDTLEAEVSAVRSGLGMTAEGTAGAVPRIAALEQSLATVQQQVGNLGQQIGTLSGLPDKLSALDGLPDKVADLERRVGALATAPQAPTGGNGAPADGPQAPAASSAAPATASNAADLASLGDTVSALAAKLPDLEQAVAGVRSDLQDLEAKLQADIAAAVQAAPFAPSDDVDALTKKVDALAGNLAAARESLQASVAQLTSELSAAGAASDRKLAAHRQSIEGEARAAQRLAATALATAAFADALQTGKPFSDELPVLARAADGEGAVDTLRPFADKGIPTRAALVAEIDRARPDLVAATAERPGGFVGSLMSSAEGLLSVRTVDPDRARGISGILDEIDGALARGDFEAAVSAWNKLPETLRQRTADWQRAVAARAAAETLVAAIGRKVLAGGTDPAPAGGAAAPAAAPSGSGGSGSNGGSGDGAQPAGDGPAAGSAGPVGPGGGTDADETAAGSAPAGDAAASTTSAAAND